MFTKLKTIGLGGVVAAAAIAGTVVMTPGVANAATYNGVCGSGYVVIDHANLSTLGTVFVTYNSSTGKNCVVTVRNNPGTRLPMTAEVSLAGDPWIIDSGNYTTYAGPKYVVARNQCIDWGGSIENVGFVELDSHCA
jgi:hypothetical protein